MIIRKKGEPLNPLYRQHDLAGVILFPSSLQQLLHCSLSKAGQRSNKPLSDSGILNQVRDFRGIW